MVLRRVPTLPLLALCAALLAACEGEPTSNTAAPTGSGEAESTPVVVATTGMIADVVRNVAGERVEVVGLMGEGVDPHLYKPTRSDIAEINRADLIFYNGLLLEGKMTDALIRAATGGKKVVAVTEQIEEEYLLEPAEFEGLWDPHVWMDPTAWARAVDVIRDALIELDPAGEALYWERAASYRETLAELDTYCESILETVPERSRVLVTAHDAFNYFGRRYGYEVVGIQGLSTESEAGVRDIERIVDLLVEREIGAVFTETTISERNVQALVAGARAEGHTVVVGGSLFSDAMGAPGTYEGTYVGMIDTNVTTIVRALGGDAPEGGFRDRTQAAAAPEGGGQ